jgi:hypothetical protein
LGFLIVYYPAGLFMKMPGFWKSDFGLFCKVYGIVLAVGLVPGYFILCLFHYLRAYVQVGKRKRIRYWRLWLALLHAFVTLIPIALIFYYWSNDRKDNFWVLAFLAISIIVAGVKCLSEMLNDGYAPRMVEWAFLKGEKHALKRFSNVKPSILPAKYRVILFCVAYFFLLHLTIPFLCGILGTLLHSNHLLDQGLILLFCYTLASLTSFWLITPFTNYLYNYDYRRDLSSAAVKKTILITVPVALVLKVLVLFLTFDAGVISKLISFGLPLVSCGLGVVLMDKFRKNDSVNS